MHGVEETKDYAIVWPYATLMTMAIVGSQPDGNNVGGMAIMLLMWVVVFIGAPLCHAVYALPIEPDPIPGEVLL